MTEPPPRSRGDGGGRLERCIRDLAALSALPSMCVGRTPEEAFEIVLDALPTALGCELVILTVPGAPVRRRGMFAGEVLGEPEVESVMQSLLGAPETDSARTLPAMGRLWCLEVEVPIGAHRGLLVAGRRTELHPETDRVLIRSAANLVGSTLETANVLDGARRKDEFLAILGHELRNPLAPIAIAVELLGRHPEVAREQQIIERHTRHLTRLVDDLLDISRVTRGHVELRNEQVTLGSVLQRAVEIASALVARNHHVLDVAKADDVLVRGDPVRLAQVFGNLLTNAAKFTPTGGRIAIEVDRAPGRVRVTVRDNGRGIAQSQLARIFEPFVQADRPNDALRGGLGLGLAIVSNLVERHGGSITAQSDGLGHGSAFTVELPTTARVAEQPAILQPKGTKARNRVRVLVVDDNADIAELMSAALELEGFKTAVAYQAQEALDTWASFVPHAAVLDVGLPDLDGYELAKTLRAHHGNDATLIAATGYGERKDRLRAAESGFDCHFVKPVSVHDLVRVLDERVVDAGRLTPI